MLGIFLLIGFVYFSNNAVEISPYTIKSNHLPKALDGFKIVHLADLQSKAYGEGQKHLLKLIKNQEPDLIVFTGDLIDRRHYAKQPAIELMAGCHAIAPTAFVTGNHEIWHGSSEPLKAELEALGILVLDNKSIRISKNNVSFTLTGIADRAAFMNQADYETALNYLYDLPANGVTQVIAGSEKKSNAELHSDFNILLSHRPELFSTYAQTGYDLTFSGHSHGGQIRLPFLGGLIAPNQGILPEYDGGHFSLESARGDSQMLVSRGLGNSIFPLRVFNRPEIPVITLKSK